MEATNFRAMNLSVIKSIVGSSLLKLSSSVITFVTIPILIDTLGTEQYGVWVTVSTLIVWITLFDLGSGITLKNKLAEASATNGSVQELIAGTIQFYGIITTALLLIFAGSLFFFQVFIDHTLLALCIYLPVIVSFPLTLGAFMLQGMKKFNQASFIQFTQPFLWLIAILLFKYGVIKVQLATLGLFYGLIFGVVNLIVFIFAAKYVKFKFRLLLDTGHLASSKKSLQTGLKFFVLQVSSLLLYSIGNILIYDHLSLHNVAQYDTINKVFALGITVFNIIITVYWAEISQAKALKDKGRLLKIRKQLLLWGTVFSIGTIGFSVFLPDLLSWWTSGKIIVPGALIIPFVALLCIQIFSCVGTVFLNAFEELGGQIVLSVLSALLVIPLANLLFAQSMGIGAVPVASALLAVPALLYSLFKGNACIKRIGEYV
jgi:O-antigen/teichoic acid export membrane protein